MFLLKKLCNHVNYVIYCKFYLEMSAILSRYAALDTNLLIFKKKLFCKCCAKYVSFSQRSHVIAVCVFFKLNTSYLVNTNETMFILIAYNCRFSHKKFFKRL